MNRITGITGKNKLEGSDAERNQLSSGEGNEMEKVIKHVSKNCYLKIIVEIDHIIIFSNTKKDAYIVYFIFRCLKKQIFIEQDILSNKSFET